MGLKTMIFYTKIAVSLIAGLIAGAIGISGIVGIAFFILTFFLSTALFLTLKRDTILNLGFYKIYREGIGSSFIAFLLTWSIATSLTLGQPTIYLATSSIGPHPICYSNGTPVPPSFRPLNSTFNAVYVVKLSENKTWKIMLGVYSEYEDKVILELPKCSVIYLKSNNTIELSTTISLEELTQNRTRWGIKFAKEDSIIFAVYEGTRVRLEEGRTLTIELRGDASTYLVYMTLYPDHLQIETEFLKVEGNSLNLTGTPFSDTICFICLRDNQIYAFESHIYTYRTIGFEDEYLVLEKTP